jgi:hypothetical protein
MRRAFTILEMLAATALTALLMLAVFQVIGSIGRTRAAMAKQPETGFWRADLLDTLRRDLSNSTAIRYETGGVTLIGHAALDRATLAPTDEPVTVTYGITTLAGRSWLYRLQTPRMGAGRRPWRELVCADVTDFSVRPTATVALPAAAEGQDAQPLPAAVVVEIAGRGGPIARETVVLR